MAPLHMSSPADLALVGVAFLASYIIGMVFYNLFIHPLRSFPGPLLNRICIFPRLYHSIRGKLPFVVAELHAKYGPVVRLAPGELSFADVQAWKDIYGHRHGGAQENPKDDRVYRQLDDIPRNILSAGRDEHTSLRRQLAHGFSERSMHGQEPIIGSYVDMLIERLHQNSQEGAIALNMRDWFNFTTFDIIGDLGFGSPFGCLDTSTYHPWIRIITDNIRHGAYFAALTHIGLRRVLQWMAKLRLLKKRDTHMSLVKEKLYQRMELGAERPDFIEGLLKKKDEWQMDINKLAANSSLIIIAGSETTATLLSGAAFLLTTNPDKLAVLAKEVRTSFSSEEEITLLSVNKLDYMLACLNEALRRYPPVTGALPRVSPKGGTTITGKFVPENTSMAVWQWPINHNPNYWTNPMAFAPERWLGDPRFAGDKLEAMQPFSVGPRNCIGRNLAYAEMRLIMARVIYNFDMTLADESRDWLRTQKAYGIWDKPPLYIHLTPVAK
ncbi:cytochrome P450 [Xylariaceae sp. FL0662B]|nr:cytochrome P450 [Xylariaceae sp. FL0662B]